MNDTKKAPARIPGSRSGAKMFRAMELVLAGVTPYRAALRVDINLATIYKNPLYKLWLKGDAESHRQLKRVLDIDRPVKRKKPLGKQMPKWCNIKSAE